MAMVIVGTNNAEILNGTNGDDTILALDGNDWIHGNDGDDLIKGGGGADHMFGGAGNDTATYSDSTAGVLVSLLSNTGIGGTAQGDVLDSIENLTGSGYGDI